MNDTSAHSAPDLLKVDNLKTYFQVAKKGLFGRGAKTLRAVDDVSFSIGSGRVLGLVGESGCGKSTVGRTLTRLTPATAGRVTFDGQSMLDMPDRAFLPFRRRIQMIFQDPFASLNPRMTINKILTEPLIIHGLGDSNEARQRMVDGILENVGLSPTVATRYPHEFSGGQRQRIGIARAMILNPDLIIADEAVSALDVSVQAQVLNLMKALQRRTGVAMLFISHDLGVVRHICDDVAVMYLGRIVEIGSKTDIFENPQHPYTKLLLGSIPRVRSSGASSRPVVSGEQPSPLNRPDGCRFVTRCVYAMDRCSSVEPQQLHISPSHFCACHLVSD